MKPGLFISYSRRQTPFVDRLAEKLERNGYSVWLDYQCLVPAKPWFEQIQEGVAEADAVLLIVSRDSMSSKHVEPEWRMALDLGKRVILLIFEAVPLPLELQKCEWIDFRIAFTKSIEDLEKLLDQPKAEPPSPAPQAGFKAPKRVWLALALSIFVLIGSIPTWWTILLPFILIPLPRQIYNRNYIYSRVVPALLILPIALFLTDVLFIIEKGSIFSHLDAFYTQWATPTGFAGLALLVLLLTPVMQRRAKPEAAQTHFANPLVVDEQKPRSVLFAIDHAPEDGRYAEDLRYGLERYGHRLAKEGEKPEAIFALLSNYKKETTYDPAQQAVYPVLLQSVRADDLAEKLRYIQWLDLRNGIRSINKLARLLPEPDRLLRALAIPPTGTQETFPPAVSTLQYFYLVMGIMSGGIILTTLISTAVITMQSNTIAENWQELLFMVISGILLFGTMIYSVNGLRTRNGGVSSAYPLLILTIYQAVIIFFSIMAALNFSGGTNQDFSDKFASAGNSAAAMVFIFGLGILIAFFILLFRWRELYRWLPRHQVISVNRLESALLLYTPINRPVLILHLIFHILLLITFTLVMSTLLIDVATGYALPLLLLLLWGVHRLAKRFSK